MGGWAGAARRPPELTATASVNQVVSYASAHQRVNYYGGDMLVVEKVKRASDCAAICCNVRKAFLINEVLDAYTWASNTCWCKVYSKTHGTAHQHAVSGKC